MAVLTVPDQNEKLTDALAICELLKQFGIWYERCGAEHSVGPDASADEILKGYAAEIDALKARGGYVTADVIDVTPETPGLDAMLNRFNKEHTHAEDEVRFFDERLLDLLDRPHAQCFKFSLHATDRPK